MLQGTGVTGCEKETAGLHCNCGTKRFGIQREMRVVQSVRYSWPAEIQCFKTNKLQRDQRFDEHAILAVQMQVGKPVLVF